METRCGTLQHMMAVRLVVYVWSFIDLSHDNTSSYRNPSIDCIDNQSTGFYMRETLSKKDNDTICHLTWLMPVADRDRCRALFGSRTLNSRPSFRHNNTDTTHLLPLDLPQHYPLSTTLLTWDENSENTPKGCCLSKQIGEMLTLGHRWPRRLGNAI